MAEVGGLVRRRLDLAHTVPRRTGLREPSQRQVGEDGRHYVAELVSDAPGENAEALASLGFEDLGLKLEVRLLRPHAV